MVLNEDIAIKELVRSDINGIVSPTQSAIVSRRFTVVRCQIRSHLLDNYINSEEKFYRSSEIQTALRRLRRKSLQRRLNAAKQARLNAAKEAIVG